MERNMSETYLVTGGARSGKSRHALNLGDKAEKPFYIATGWAGDAEMEDRIAKHKAERGPHWSTIETKTGIVSAIAEAEEKGADFILVDCLTLWTSNMLFEKKDELEAETAKLAKLIPTLKTKVAFVTNEVGSGIVPGDSLSREFRDAAGLVNQKIAAAVDNVILAVSGIPIKIK
jgi:adenosylcobinamide kinase/adenosylcobinamide-phosphate guanylyltransferase